MFTSTLSNQFITREGEAGEAPAEPWRRQLGRSLALPLFFKRLCIAKMFTGMGERLLPNHSGAKLGRSLALPLDSLAGSFQSAARASKSFLKCDKHCWAKVGT